MSKRGVAIVGTGASAGLHAAGLAELGDRVRLVAVVDIDRHRLEAFADRWQVPHRFERLEEMLEARRPEVVHLCTPPAGHREQAVACLTRGVTTVCEKPPALSLAQLDEIALAEDSGNAGFACVFQQRFGSGARTARALVRSGVLGRPLAAVCNTLWFRTDGYFATPWRGRWEVEGGGPTIGHGIHQTDLLLSILGPWSEVVAVADRRARPTATEDVSAALVTFADGTLATVLNSVVSPRQTSYLRVDLEHATIELEHLYGYDDSCWRITPAAGHEERVAREVDAGPRGQPSSHAAQFAAILDALDAGTAPPVRTAEARLTLELVAAVYASAFTGRRIRRGDIDADSPFYVRMQGTGAPWSDPAGVPAP